MEGDAVKRFVGRNCRIDAVNDPDTPDRTGTLAGYAQRNPGLLQRRSVVPRSRSCVIIVALLVLLSRPLAGAEDNQTGFHIVKERDGDTTTLIIKSDYACEFTVTFEGTLKNTTASRPLPFTVDAAGRSSFVLVRFQRTNRRLAWRYAYRYYKQLGGRRASTSNDADYAMPFKPGRYVVMQGPRGSLFALDLMVTVASCFDIQEALSLQIALGAADIPSFIPDEATAQNVPYFFIGSEAGVRLQVVEERAAEAQQIINNIREERKAREGDKSNEDEEEVRY